MVKYNTAASYLDFILTISATADLQKSSEPEPLWAVALGLAGPEVTGKHASPPHQRTPSMTSSTSHDESAEMRKARLGCGKS